MPAVQPCQRAPRPAPEREHERGGGDPQPRHPERVDAHEQQHREGRPEVVEDRAADEVDVGRNALHARQHRAGCATIPGVIAGVSAQTPSNRRQIDDIDLRLLAELQEDARLSNAELGRRVGLSAPAVAERVARLQRVRRDHAASTPRSTRARSGSRCRRSCASAPRRASSRRSPSSPATRPRWSSATADHGRRLLLPEAPRPRRGAPRAGDRRGSPSSVRRRRRSCRPRRCRGARSARHVAEVELVGAAGPRGADPPAAGGQVDARRAGPVLDHALERAPAALGDQPQRPGRRRAAGDPEDLVRAVLPRRGGQRIAEQDRRELARRGRSRARSAAPDAEKPVRAHSGSTPRSTAGAHACGAGSSEPRVTTATAATAATASTPRTIHRTTPTIRPPDEFRFHPRSVQVGTPSMRSTT